MTDKASGNPIVQFDKNGVYEMTPEGIRCVAPAEKIVRTATKADAPEIKAIFEHPEIRPSIGDVPLEVEAIAAALDHLIVLLWRKSLFMLAQVTPEVLEVHVAVHPDDRGKPALEATQTALEMLFLTSPCREIVGSTPRTNIGGQLFNRWAGFEVIGERSKSIVWSLPIHRWARVFQDSEARNVALRHAHVCGQYAKVRAAMVRAQWERRMLGGF